MGWKSTTNITREDMLEAIEKRLYEATDSQLEEVMEDLYGDEKGMNFSTVPEYNENNKPHWNSCFNY